MMNTITFKAVRTVYMENGKSRKTVKTYETYEQAKAYAKRYSKITASKATSRQKFVNVSVYINTDDYKYQNVDIYTIDSNEFEIEHLEQIEKFQRDVEAVKEKAPKYLVKGMNGFEFETSDLLEARKTLNNVCFKSENINVEFSVIELNSKEVLIEGKPSNPEQREALNDFILGLPAYKIEGFTTETEEEAIAIAETVANEKGKAVKIYRYRKEIKTVEPNKDKYIVIEKCKPDYSGTEMFGSKEEVIERVKKQVEETGHFYKVYRQTNGGNDFVKVVGFKKFFKVGKEGENPSEGFYSCEEADKIAQEIANKEGIKCHTYKCRYDCNGFLNCKQWHMFEPKQNETAEEPTEKIIGFRVGLGGKIYKTADEAFKNNPKNDKQVFKIIDNGDGLTWEYIPIDKSEENDMKTLQEWEEKGGNFADFCKVGDKVDKGIVDYFVDVLPPITWRTDLVQCGEPYGHRDNPKTGRWEAMYITFAKNDNGQWYYAGICFLNQREAIA